MASSPCTRPILLASEPLHTLFPLRLPSSCSLIVGHLLRICLLREATSASLTPVTVLCGCSHPFHSCTSSHGGHWPSPCPDRHLLPGTGLDFFTGTRVSKHSQITPVPIGPRTQGADLGPTHGSWGGGRRGDKGEGYKGNAHFSLLLPPCLCTCCSLFWKLLSSPLSTPNSSNFRLRTDLPPIQGSLLLPPAHKGHQTFQGPSASLKMTLPSPCSWTWQWALQQDRRQKHRCAWTDQNKKPGCVKGPHQETSHRGRPVWHPESMKNPYSSTTQRLSSQLQSKQGFGRGHWTSFPMGDTQIWAGFLAGPQRGRAPAPGPRRRVGKAQAQGPGVGVRRDA